MAVFVVLGLLVVAAIVVWIVQADPPPSTQSADRPERTTTTEIPRGQSPIALDRYCTTPGVAWPEVPPHVPGQPSRAWVHLDRGEGHATALYTRTRPMSWTRGGSTVLSPATDGRFILGDWSVHQRTRAVACMRYLATDSVGPTCSVENDFGFGTQGEATLGRLRYEIVVYELHSGGVLSRGEVWSHVGSCTGAVEDGASLVVRPITDQDVLGWIASHFVDGKPG